MVGRKPILLKSTSSKGEVKFFETIKEASEGLGFSDHGLGKAYHAGRNRIGEYNNKKRSHTQLDCRKQVIAFQDRVITINIKEAQHPLK